MPQLKMPSLKDDKGYNQGYKPSAAVEARTDYRCNAIINEMASARNANILEIGCGTGALSHLLAKKTGGNVLGVDICRPFIEQANKDYRLPNLRYDVVDFNRPDTIMESGKYDFVVGDGILHHLYYNIEQSLKNIRKLLSDKGRMIFWEPNILNPFCIVIFNFKLFRKLANLEPGEMAFSRRFITHKLANAGFIDIKVRYGDFMTPITPSFLIKPILTVGPSLERVPIINTLAQSLFISAQKG